MYVGGEARLLSLYLLAVYALLALKKYTGRDGGDDSSGLGIISALSFCKRATGTILKGGKAIASLVSGPGVSPRSFRTAAGATGRATGTSIVVEGNTNCSS